MPARSRVAASARAGRVALNLAAILSYHGIASLARRTRPAQAGHWDRREGRFVTLRLERLGGLWVKLGQYLSCRRDLLPEALCQSLERLQAQVAPERGGHVEGLLRQLVRDHPGIAVDPTPFAAGCLAQVHGARRADGTALVVKLRRRNVSALLAADAAVLRWGAGRLARLRRFSDLPMVRIVDEISDLMLGQADLAREAGMIAQLSPYLRRWRIECPRPVETGREWLIMTRLAGRHVGEAATHNIALARAGVIALYHMLFERGQVHADLHPGNVLVDDETLRFLDFGLVVRLDDRTRMLFRDFFLAFASCRGRRCAEILVETAAHVPMQLDAAVFGSEVQVIVSAHYGKRAAQFETVAFARDIFTVQRRHGLIASTGFCSAILSIVVFETVVKRIDPDCDFQALARVTLPQIVGRQAPRRPWDDGMSAWSYPVDPARTSLVQQRL